VASLSVRRASCICRFLKAYFYARATVYTLVTALHEGFEEICTFDRHQQAAMQALGLAITTI
jgi:hypothetical protein